MAAPTPSARVAPTGRKLGTGYQTLIAFALDTNIQLWEQSVTPPGIDADEAIETTTQHNVTWRTFSPQELLMLTDAQAVCHYDPAVFTALLALAGIPTTVTVHYPDHSSLCFFGYLRSATPSELVRGVPPTVTIVIKPTNQDPVNCVEAGPIFTAGPGTGPC